MKKKAQVQRVFVYLLSIIMVVFVAFLVGRFIFAFSSDVEQRSEVQVFNLLERDFDAVYRTYGSEKVFDYRISHKTEAICFVENKACIQRDLNELNNISSSAISELEIAYDGGDNVALFDSSGIVSSQNIGEFKAQDGECFCIRPNNNRFSLVFENDKNVVYIGEN